MTSRLTAALPSGSILQRVICTATPRRRTMSISALSALTANSVQSSSSQPSVWQAFNQLVSSLDSGKLSDAQQAYSALSELQSSSQSSNSNTPFAKALNQIGQALQNGDLNGAQQALASLQQAQAGHHHHG